MKNKKLLSTVLAATLAATTMAVPVMAEDGGGSITVDVGSATSVLRVEVPTTLAVQIDQYQLEQSSASGDCQIYSEEFSILNKGNINVKVDVTSAVSGDVKKDNKLATTKQAAKGSKSGDAWLAVAAATDLTINGGAAGTYVYDDKDTSGDETYATLKETNKNVATFNKSGDAKQTFYLEKASGDVTYKYATSGDTVVPYAKFHKLASVAGITSGDTAVTTAAKDKDVYVQLSGDPNMTKVRKGETYSGTRTFDPASGDACYTISGEATSLDAGDYMYGEGNVKKDGAAAFRYIGVLAKGKTWTTKDIKQIEISYTIDGIDPGTYAEAYGKCTQGLYKEAESSNPGLVYVSGKDNADVVLKFTPPEGKTLATDYATVNGVNASTWGSFSSNFIFNTNNNTVTIKAAVFGFSSVSGATTDHKYTFTVKDSAGTVYSTEEVNLAP